MPDSILENKIEEERWKFSKDAVKDLQAKKKIIFYVSRLRDVIFYGINDLIANPHEIVSPLKHPWTEVYGDGMMTQELSLDNLIKNDINLRDPSAYASLKGVLARLNKDLSKDALLDDLLSDPEMVKLLDDQSSRTRFSILGRLRINDRANQKEDHFYLTKPVLIVPFADEDESKKIERWENSHTLCYQLGLIARKISEEDYLNWRGY